MISIQMRLKKELAASRVLSWKGQWEKLVLKRDALARGGIALKEEKERVRSHSRMTSKATHHL
jgi:hypothetical protein